MIIAIIGIVVFIAITYPRFYREMQATKAHLLNSSQILKTEHGTLEYSVQGEGIPILLLHGAGGGYDQGLWLGKMAFGNGHKFIAVSRYGYLRTPIPTDASIQTQSALYKDLLEYLDIPKVIVVGVSAGGPSATQFANDYPEMTSGLILISAVSRAPFPNDKPAFYIGIIHLVQQSDYVYWLVVRYLQPVILDLMGVPSEIYKNFSPIEKQLAQEMLDTMHPMTQRYAGTKNDENMIRRNTVSTDNISAPTLILHSKDDALVSYHHAEHAHNTIENSRLILFESGGHGMLSRMNEVRKNIKESLN